MTDNINKFLRKLGKATVKKNINWYVTKDGRIRGKYKASGFNLNDRIVCPVTSLVDKTSICLAFATGFWLELSKQEISSIIDAADLTEGFDPELRQKILNTIGI